MSTPDGELRGTVRGPSDRSDRRRLLLLVASVVLAAAAAVVGVLSDDARWLRLGVVAALWAALTVAFAIARGRDDDAGDTSTDLADDEAGEGYADAVAEARARTHELELELEREVAARREHEVERSEEIAGLRDELERLRTHLDAATTDRRAGLLRVVGESPVPPPAAARSAPLRPVDADTPRLGVGPAPSNGHGPSKGWGPPQGPAPAPALPALPGPPPTGSPSRPGESPLAARRAPSEFDRDGTPLPGSPAARRDRGVPYEPYAAWEPAPERPGPDPSPLGATSFVDQYVRSAGYDLPDPTEAAPGPSGPPGPPHPPGTSHPPGPSGPPVPDRPGASGGTTGWGSAANRAPAQSWAGAPTTGRTVAELLAAHTAAAGPGRRRRRDEQA